MRQTRSEQGGRLRPFLRTALFLLLLSPTPGRAQELSHTAYNQQFYVGTHNAFANTAEGYSNIAPNQERSIRRQLEDGVRVLGLDLWQVKQKRFGITNAFLYWDRGERRYKSSASRADDELFDFGGVGPEIVVGHAIDKYSYYLLRGQGIAYVDKNDSPFPWDWTTRDSKFRSLYEVLRDVREFMDQHAEPNGPVVTLELESYVGDRALLRRAFERAHLWDRIFYADRPNEGCWVVRDGITAEMRVPWEVSKHGWPTTNEMKAWRRDLVVFTDSPDDDGMPSADEYVVASAGDPKCFDPELCTDTATGSQPLNRLDRALLHLSRAREQTVVFGINLGDINNAPEVFQFWQTNFLHKWDTGAWNPLCGRLPTSCSVDYYNRGGLLGEPGPLWLVPRFNQEWRGYPDAEASVARRDQRPPTVNGWHRDSVVVHLNNHRETDPEINLSQAVRVSASPLPGVAGQTQAPEVVYFRYGDIPSSQAILTVSQDGTTLVAYHGINRFGKNGPLRFEVIRVDKNAPTSQMIDYKIGPGQHGVELESYDSASGVERTYYRLDGGPWQNGTGEITLVLPDGRHTLEYFGVDRAGHTEALQTRLIRAGEFADDVIAPVTTLLPPFDNDVSFPFGGLSVTDYGTPVSGWAGSTFLLNGHEVDTTQGQEEFVSFVRNSPWLRPGFNDVRFFSRDRAGNVENAKSLRYFNGRDAAPPTTTLTLEDYIGNLKKVRLGAEDAGSPASGVYNTFYRLNNGPMVAYVDSETARPTLIPGRHVIEYWSQDNLDNAEPRHVKTLFVGPVESTGEARVTPGTLRYERATDTWRQPVTVTNRGGETLGHPVSLVLGRLPAGVTLRNETGKTSFILPARMPYLDLPYELYPGESVTLTLIFSKSGNAAITYDPRVYTHPGTR
jgi:hypothetical protein